MIVNTQDIQNIDVAPGIFMRKIVSHLLFQHSIETTTVVLISGL